MPTQVKKLTWDDYARFPDDGNRHELIDGRHYVSPSPRSRHQDILANLHLLLAPKVRELGLGRLFFAPLDVIFSDFDVVEPDLLFVRKERAGIVQDWVRGAPDLVVEIISPSTRPRDERLKRDLYERFGVAEYWLVDPEAETVAVYRREGEQGWRDAEVVARESGDVLRSPLLPEVEAPLADLFAE